MNGSFSIRIERLLGARLGPGEGTVWQLEAVWPLPLGLTVLLALLAVAFVVGIYLREGQRTSRAMKLSLAGMRLLVVAAVAVMLAQVTLVRKLTGLPYLAVLADDSLSMTVVDRFDDKVRTALSERLQTAGLSGPTVDRWGQLRTLLCERDAAMLRSLADDYRLRFYWLSGGAAESVSDAAEFAKSLKARAAEGESSRLGATLRTILDDLRGSTPAAIVVLSDGVNTDGPPLAEAAKLARRKGVPLYFVGIGSDQPVRDLRLSDLLADDVAFVNDILSFELKLTATGLAGSRVPIVLREKDKPQALVRQDVTVGQDGEPQTVRLPYRPTRVGRFTYVIEAETPEGEMPPAGKQLEHNVDVRKQRIRVLLADGTPRDEFRFLRNLLARDETIELRTVLQDADPEYAEQDSAALPVFPVRREDLLSYDVIIFGDLDPRQLGEAALLSVAEFVDRPDKGGALVLIAGPRHLPQAYGDTPLARLMPFDLGSTRYPDLNQVQSKGFKVQPTELGLATPAMQLGDTPAETRTIWQNLPQLYWTVEAGQLRPGARVLAEHSTRTTSDGRRLPLIVLQYVGAGKVLAHTIDETYRWRFRVGDVFFARYWVQMLRYLSRTKLSAGEQAVLVTTDQTEYQRGESVRVRVKFSDERNAPVEDDGVTVAVEQTGRPPVQLKLQRTAGGRGTFEGLLSRPAPGSYHLRMVTPAVEQGARAADFIVKPPAGEFERVQMDAAAMRAAATQTKGQFYTFDTAGRLLRELPPGQQVPIESLPPVPLWNSWPLVLVVMLLLVGEWVIRKLVGLV